MQMDEANEAVMPSLSSLILYMARKFPDGEIDTEVIAEQIDRLEADLKSRNAELSKLKEQLALAIAHDRQPYPTAEAYERVCEALREKEKQLDAVQKAADALAEAATGLSHGADWNNGTHVKLYGYRQKLLDSLAAYRSERDNKALVTERNGESRA